MMTGGDVAVFGPTMCCLSDYPFETRSADTLLMEFDFGTPVTTQQATVVMAVTPPSAGTNIDTNAYAFLDQPACGDTVACSSTHALVVWLDVILDAEATLLGGPSRCNAFVKQAIFVFRQPLSGDVGGPIGVMIYTHRLTDLYLRFSACDSDLHNPQEVLEGLGESYEECEETNGKPFIFSPFFIQKYFL